jgi:CRP/FNR family transcriptional regulator, cyclic AMP receptor protein
VAGAANRVRRGAPEIRVLEADPDLARQLDPVAAREAASRVRARIAALAEGPWQPRFGGDVRGLLGLLVLDGVLARQTSIGEASCTELVGSGDVLRPWEGRADAGVIPCEVSWRVLDEARVAVLDRRFAEQIAPWPEITAELMARTLRRSRWQALTAAIGHVKRVDLRLVILMWHLAERWGRVTPAGIVIPLHLTHERLGALVGAQRPSVTTALTRLAERRLVARRPDRCWLLLPAARHELERICSREDVPPVTALAA